MYVAISCGNIRQSQPFISLSLSLTACITIKWDTPVAPFYLSNSISTYWYEEYDVEAPGERSLILNNMAGNNVTVFFLFFFFVFFSNLIS